MIKLTKPQLRLLGELFISGPFYVWHKYPSAMALVEKGLASWTGKAKDKLAITDKGKELV